MHLNMCWPITSHASKDTKWVNTCWPNPSHPIEDIICISTCVDKNHPMSPKTLNTSQHVLTKSHPLQREHKMNFNMCRTKLSHARLNTNFWPDPSHASENTKCIPSFVDQTHPMPARTQNVSQHVLTKPLPCQWGHEMYLNLCWPNLSHASEDT